MTKWEEEIKNELFGRFCGNDVDWVMEIIKREIKDALSNFFPVEKEDILKERGIE